MVSHVTLELHETNERECVLKLEFHDANTDTDMDILARILADTSDTRD